MFSSLFDTSFLLLLNIFIFITDTKNNMRVHKDTAMHDSCISHTVQLGPAPEGGVPIWSSPLLGDLHILVAGCRSTDDVAATGYGTAKPSRSCRSMEGCADFKR